jgi:hypothetical protein
MQNFHKTIMGPAFGGIPLRTMALGNTPSSSVFGGLGDFGQAFRSVFDPFDLFGVATGLSKEIIHAPVEIVHEVGTAFTGGITAVGSTVTGVAASLENTASSIFSSPVILIGGAAVLLILLSK